MTPLSAHVASISANAVTLKTADNQTLRLPTEAVFGTPKAGQEIRLLAAAVGSEDAGKTAFAQTLLNELLGSQA